MLLQHNTQQRKMLRLALPAYSMWHHVFAGSSCAQIAMIPPLALNMLRGYIYV